jgi:hypothetical protein
MTSDDKNYRQFWLSPTFKDKDCRYNYVDDMKSPILIHTIEYSAFEAAQKEIEKLKKVIGIQGKTLEFYSAELSWDSGSDYINNIIDGDDVELIDRIIEGHDCSDYYGGQLARQALKEAQQIMEEK